MKTLARLAGAVCFALVLSGLIWNASPWLALPTVISGTVGYMLGTEPVDAD